MHWFQPCRQSFLLERTVPFHIASVVTERVSSASKDSPLHIKKYLKPARRAPVDKREHKHCSRCHRYD